MGTGCTHAVVCLHTEKSNGPGKNIGHFKKRKFYIEGMLFSFSTVQSICISDQSPRLLSNNLYYVSLILIPLHSTFHIILTCI